MNQVLHKLETSSQLMRWLIKLSQYKISHWPRAIICSEAIVDFIIEFNPIENLKLPTVELEMTLIIQNSHSPYGAYMLMSLPTIMAIRFDLVLIS